MRFRHGIHLRAAVAWLLSPTQSAPLVYGRLMNVGTWRAPATSMATAIRRLHPLQQCRSKSPGHEMKRNEAKRAGKALGKTLR